MSALGNGSNKVFLVQGESGWFEMKHFLPKSFRYNLYSIIDMIANCKCVDITKKKKQKMLHFCLGQM